MYTQSFDIDELLSDLMSSNKEKVLIAAMELSNLGLPVVRELIDRMVESDDAKRKIISGVLINIGADAVNDVIDLLINNNELRNYAALILRDIGKTAARILVKELNNDQPEIRALVAEILGEIKDTDTVKYLRNKLDDDSEEVLIAIKSAIKEIEKPFVSKVTEALEASKRIEEMVDSIDLDQI